MMVSQELKQDPEVDLMSGLSISGVRNVTMSSRHPLAPAQPSANLTCPLADPTIPPRHEYPAQSPLATHQEE